MSHLAAIAPVDAVVLFLLMPYDPIRRHWRGWEQHLGAKL